MANATNKVTNISATFKKLDLKNSQDLAHAPTDFTNAESMNSRTARAINYASSEYSSPFRTFIGSKSPSNSMGLSLPLNNRIGAPAASFVYGVSHQGGTVADHNLIRMAYGPQPQAFHLTPGISIAHATGETVFNDPLALISSTTPNTTLPTIPGSITGIDSTAETTTFIAHAIEGLPSNIAKTNSAKLQQEYSYITDNIWVMTSMIGEGVQTPYYIYGNGPQLPAAVAGQGYIHQAGPQVNFVALGTQIYLKRYFEPGYYGVGLIDKVKSPKISGGGADGSDIAEKTWEGRSKWHFTGDSFRVMYYAGLNPSGGTSASSSGVVSSVYIPLVSQLMNTGNVLTQKLGIIEKESADSPGFGHQWGFTVNMKFKPSAITSAYKGHLPTLVFYIGDDRTIKNNAIQGAIVTIANSTAPRIQFPVRTHAGSKYRIDSNNSGAVKNSGSIVQNIISGTSVLTEQEQDLVLTFEGLGDSGVISLSQGSSPLVEAVIAPQMSVSADSTGLVQATEISHGCYCAIKGYFYIEASECNGSFNAGPACYNSWNAGDLMFMYYPFTLNSSQTTAEIMGETINPWAKSEYSYFFNDLSNQSSFPAGTNPNSINQQTLDRTPDIISDARGGCPIGFTKQILSSQGTQTKPAWTSVIYPALSDRVTGPIKEIVDFGTQQLQDRGYIPASFYAGNESDYTCINIYCAAFWAHTHHNSQLRTVWPSGPHTEWIGRYKTKTTQLNFRPTTCVVSDEVKSFNISRTIQGDAPILTQTSTIVIENPSASLMTFLSQATDEDPALIEGTKGWVELQVYTESQESTTISGFIIDYSFAEKSTGVSVTIKIQDPFSLLMTNLQYPSAHPIDGWFINHAVPYLLGRTGLPLDESVYSIGANLSRIGRFIATDLKTTNATFQQGALQSSIGSALGTIPIYEYPLFYWDSNIGKVVYKNIAPPIYPSSIFGGSSVNLFDAEMWHSINKPISKDSMTLNVQSKDFVYQTLLSSVDRFRNTDMILPVGLNATRKRAGYKNEASISSKGIVTDVYELNELRRAITSQYPEFAVAPMNVSFTAMGLPVTGTGSIIRSYSPLVNRSDLKWMLNDTAIAWGADKNEVTTTYTMTQARSPLHASWNYFVK